MLFIPAVILIYFFMQKGKKDSNGNAYPMNLLVFTNLTLAPAIYEPFLLFFGLFLFDNPHGYKYVAASALYIIFILWAPILIKDYFWSFRLYDKYKSVKIAILPQVCTYLVIILLATIWSW